MDSENIIHTTQHQTDPAERNIKHKIYDEKMTKVEKQPGIQNMSDIGIS